MTETYSGSNAGILLIGKGRLARHLEHWHNLTQSPETTLLKWDRTQTESELDSVLQQKPLVWLAISDSSIAEFYEKYLANKDLRTVHFSGAFYHAKILSAHPLMSFTEKLFEDDFYKTIHFVISGFQNLQEAMPGFENPYSVISEKDKAFYHALCVVAGNFPQMLWAEVFREASDLKIPAAAFETYIKKITENFVKQKAGALTGPLVRKDTATIKSNLTALNRNKLLQDVYSAFAKEYLK